MKQKCTNCDKVFYPTKNNYVGYPWIWHSHRSDIDWSHSRIFCTNSCMGEFISKHNDIILQFFKQIKESEDINNARTRENQAECEQAASP